MQKNNMGDLPEILNLSRFRPTKITQMLREGYDITDIQMVAGHANLSTTYLYLDQTQLQEPAYTEISRTLKTIYRNQIHYEVKVKPAPIEIPGIGCLLTSPNLIVMPKHLPDLLRLQQKFSESGEPTTTVLAPVLTKIMEAYSAEVITLAKFMRRDSSDVVSK